MTPLCAVFHPGACTCEGLCINRLCIDEGVTARWNDRGTGPNRFRVDLLAEAAAASPRSYLLFPSQSRLCGQQVRNKGPFSTAPTPSGPAAKRRTPRPNVWLQSPLGNQNERRGLAQGGVHGASRMRPQRLREQCFIEDEGRPLGVGVQELASNHFKLRGLRVRVVIRSRTPNRLIFRSVKCGSRRAPWRD